MAYGLKYQSSFYNFHKVQVSVVINKKDYTGGYTNLRTSEVTIEANYQDDNTPVIGRGAKVVVIFENNDLTTCEDLLTSYEKEFECVISYGAQIVFRGFSLCDLNERQLLPYCAVTLQFTDYLHRLSEDYPACLKVAGDRQDMLTLVNNVMEETGMELSLRVNSTIFEVNMNKGIYDTWLPQTFFQNANFYKTQDQYDNMYDALNKALVPFNAFMYYHNDSWYIERLEDVTRDGFWVFYSGTAAEVLVAEKLVINKQLGNFKYVDSSQIFEYNSGLHTLIIALREKQIDSLIFNDYTRLYSARRGTGDVRITTVDMFDGVMGEYYPRSGHLIPRTWYLHYDAADFSFGANYLDLETWMYWRTSTGAPACYKFAVQFNQSREGDSSGGDIEQSTQLTIDYKMATDDPTVITWINVTMRFMLRIEGGPYANWWLTNTTNDEDEEIYLLTPPLGDVLHRRSEGDISGRPERYCTFQNRIDISTNHQRSWSHSVTLDLQKTIPTILRYVGGGGYTSLWEALGYPTVQSFQIIFLPPFFEIPDPSSRDESKGIPFLGRYTFLGDVRATVTVEELDNKIEYHLNEQFYRTDEIDLHLFDLPNINFSNGLQLSNESFTKVWVSENSPIQSPLYEVFAKCKFRKYGRTIHRLKSKILYNGALKPFTIITDDNIASITNPSEPMTFLLNGFTWDLVNGTYDIVAEEYTEEEVIVEGVTYDSDGVVEINEPLTMAYLTCRMLSQFGRPVECMWSNAGHELIGYRLQRQEWWVGGAWIQDWRTVYMGPLNRFVNRVDERYAPYPTPTTINYRVQALNLYGDSAWIMDSVAWSRS